VTVRLIDIAAPLARGIELRALALGVTARDVADAVIAAVLDREEPATLRRVAAQTVRRLRAVEAGKWRGQRAIDLRMFVPIHPIVGPGDRLVEDGDGWTWVRQAAVTEEKP
jgi:hypothetical protein